MQVINAFLASSFTPVDYEYTTGTAQTVAIPSGALFMSVWMYGPGGDGEQDTGGAGQGGGGGGFVRVVNIPISAGDWAANVTYTVGTGDPTATTIDATIAAGTINFDAPAGADGTGTGYGGVATVNGWAGGGTATVESGESANLAPEGGGCGSTVSQSLEGGASSAEGAGGNNYGGGGGGSESPASAGGGAGGKVKIRFHGVSE